MYVLIHNNKIIFGPSKWNRALAKAALEKHKLTGLLPNNIPAVLPFALSDDVVLKAASLDIPNCDTMFERTHGPYWDLTTDIAKGHYEVKNLDLDTAIKNAKSELAAARWRREVGGFKMTIQNHEVTIYTGREDRNMYFQSFMMLNNDQTVSWKFDTAWLSITRSDLGNIIASGVAHIESAFLWENQLITEIEACETVEQLKLLFDTKIKEGESTDE